MQHAHTHEMILEGGQMNHVVRVGDTVRRTIRGDRSLQQHLLVHLADKDFEAAPRFLGIDEAGREVLSFIAGEVHFGIAGFTDAQLAAAAALLRRYHDLTVDFPPVAAAGAQVMCHNDWTPANCVLVDGQPAAMIDFDTAQPGSRLWDLGHAAWTWLDLGDPHWHADEQLRRLAIFTRGYEPAGIAQDALLPTIVARQAATWRWAKVNGREAGARWARQSLDWTLAHLVERVHPLGFPDLCGMR